MQQKFLVHNRGDDVGVAIAEIKAGEIARGVVLEDGSTIDLEVKNDIPLGHKLALRTIDAGSGVIKYRVRIGIATSRIGKGEHVHTHNLKSARW